MKLSIGAWAGVFAGLAMAQGTLADYQRGQGLQAKARGLVVNAPGPANWIGDSDISGIPDPSRAAREFVLVDAATATKKPAFDHDKLAAAISAASGGHYTGLALAVRSARRRAGRWRRRPRWRSRYRRRSLFWTTKHAIQFGASGFLYKCTLTDYKCTKGDAHAGSAGGRGGTRRRAGRRSAGRSRVVDGDPVDGMEYQPPSPQQGAADGRVRARPKRMCVRAPERRAGTRDAADAAGRGAAGAGTAGSPQVCASFDGKWEALIENFNVFLRPAGAIEPATPLSFDGSEGNYYTLRSLAWSPDSKKLAAYHTRPGYDRQVHYIESSPDRPGAAEAFVDPVPQAGRRAGYRLPGAVRCGEQEGNRDRSRAVPECLQPDAAGVVEG